jgi:prepilin-type N-terminal cleavage/methylation domain-containing protein
MRHKKGFTLIEILLAVAALVILAGIVILAINPSRQLAQTRNAQRTVDVNTLEKAVEQYAIDRSGTLPATLSTTPLEICRFGASDCTGLVDLSVLAASSTYVVSLPTDPISTSTNGTGYMICKTIHGRIGVYSPLAELGQQIGNGDLCRTPSQLRDKQRLTDIQAIETAMGAMYSANGYYFINPGGGSNNFFYNGFSLASGSRRAGNCGAITVEPSGYSGGAYGSSVLCPDPSNWCIKLGVDFSNQDDSAGTSCDSGTVYMRNVPLNNHLLHGAWTAGMFPYQIYAFNNFDGAGGDYFRIRYRLEGGNGRQSDHFFNGAKASCGWNGSTVTNGITCH